MRIRGHVLTGLLLLGATAARAQDAPKDPPKPLSLAELEAAAVRDSNDASAHYQLAMGYWGKKRWDDAERSLRTAVQLSPGYSEAHLALALVPERRGDKYWRKQVKEKGEAAVRAVFVESEFHYRRAFLLNPLVDLKVLGKVDLPDQFQIVRVGNQLVFVLPPWWSQTLEKAINELHTGRYETGFDRMEELVHRKEFGTDDRDLPTELLLYHGLFAAHLGHYDNAVRDFAILTGRAYAAEQDTSGTRRSSTGLGTNDYRLILARMLYLGGNAPQAMATYRRALEFDIGLYIAHVQMARMYEQEGKLEDAIKERKLALEVSPDDPDLQVELANTLVKANRFEEAVDPLGEAGRLNPRDPRVPYLQGMVALRMAHPEVARPAFQRFLEIAPSRYATQVEDVKSYLAGPQ